MLLAVAVKIYLIDLQEANLRIEGRKLLNAIRDLIDLFPRESFSSVATIWHFVRSAGTWDQSSGLRADYRHAVSVDHEGGKRFAAIFNLFLEKSKQESASSGHERADPRKKPLSGFLELGSHDGRKFMLPCPYSDLFGFALRETNAIEFDAEAITPGIQKT